MGSAGRPWHALALSERAALAPGLTQDDADALLAFAGEVGRGIEKLTAPADRRRMLDILNVTVRLRRDDSAAGIKLVRKSRFGIELRSAINLLDNDLEYKKTRTKFYTPACGKWEAKYLPQPETVAAT